MPNNAEIHHVEIIKMLNVSTFLGTYFIFPEARRTHEPQVIAPNCTVGSSARIRDVCEFCVACCNDYCRLDLLGFAGSFWGPLDVLGDVVDHGTPRSGRIEKQ